MAVLDFKPCAAASGPVSVTRAPKRRNVTVELVETDACGKLRDWTSGHYLSTMTIEGNRIQADDGHMLGIAAWLANVRTLHFTSPSFPVGVSITGVGDLPNPCLQLRSRLESQLLRGATRTIGWAEYWCDSRLQIVLNITRRSRLLLVGLLEGWEKQSLANAMGLVPQVDVHAS